MDKTGSFKSPSSALNLPMIHTELKRLGEDGEDGEVVVTEGDMKLSVPPSLFCLCWV